ncbi:MAG: SgcJ/EcaC family oxidoreductase [Vicinamibacterales bacterium]
MLDASAEAERIYRNLLDAWNRRDAAAFGGLFSASGSCVGFDGTQMNGRSEIIASLEVVFSGHQTASYVCLIREIRVLARDVILLRAVVGMVPPGATTLKPDVNAVQSAVLVAHETGFEFALLQNTPAAFHGRPELADRLTAELTEVWRSQQMRR